MSGRGTRYRDWWNDDNDRRQRWNGGRTWPRPAGPLWRRTFRKPPGSVGARRVPGRLPGRRRTCADARLSRHGPARRPGDRCVRGAGRLHAGDGHLHRRWVHGPVGHHRRRLAPQRDAVAKHASRGMESSRRAVARRSARQHVPTLRRHPHESGGMGHDGPGRLGSGPSAHAHRRLSRNGGVLVRLLSRGRPVRSGSPSGQRHAGGDRHVGVLVRSSGASCQSRWQPRYRTRRGLGFRSRPPAAAARPRPCRCGVDGSGLLRSVEGNALRGHLDGAPARRG